MEKQEADSVNKANPKKEQSRQTQGDSSLILPETTTKSRRQSARIAKRLKPSTPLLEHPELQEIQANFAPHKANIYQNQISTLGTEMRLNPEAAPSLPMLYPYQSQAYHFDLNSSSFGSLNFPSSEEPRSSHSKDPILARRKSGQEVLGYLNEIESYLGTAPRSLFQPQEAYSLLSPPKELVNEREFTFMLDQLKILENAMSKLKEYFLLIPMNFEELEKIRAAEIKVSGTLEITPASTIFYAEHSQEFINFTRLWHFANEYYAKLPIQPSTEISSPGAIFEQIALETFKPDSMVEIERKPLMAQTVEEASYVAEQKCREVYGLYKLIVNKKAMTKEDAAKQLEISSIFPAKRILLWAEEFYKNGGRFFRY